MFESSKFDKSGLKSGSHILPGPDLKKTAGFQPGLDMIFGATLISTAQMYCIIFHRHSCSDFVILYIVLI